MVVENEGLLKKIDKAAVVPRIDVNGTRTVVKQHRLTEFIELKK